MSIDFKRLTFGKYKGQSPIEISEIDPQYIVWLYDNMKEKHCSLQLRDACDLDITEEYQEFDFQDIDIWVDHPKNYD